MKGYQRSNFKTLQALRNIREVNISKEDLTSITNVFSSKLDKEFSKGFSKEFSKGFIKKKI